jgi:hypothetical protein
MVHIGMVMEEMVHGGMVMGEEESMVQRTSFIAFFSAARLFRKNPGRSGTINGELGPASSSHSLSNEVDLMP